MFGLTGAEGDGSLEAGFPADKVVVDEDEVAGGAAAVGSVAGPVGVAVGGDLDGCGVGRAAESKGEIWGAFEASEDIC